MAGVKGRSGRRNKPTALKVLHGDFDKNPQTRNKKEPTPKVGHPRKPATLQGIAATEWKRITGLLADTTVLTVDCGPAIEQYCLAYQRFRKASKYCEQHGYADRSGNAKVLQESAQLCHKWLCEFGLTPSSRTRIQIETETDNVKELKAKFLG